jgi:hypothetical protein
MLKLGKLAPRHDARTFRLAPYLAAGLPGPPKSTNWTRNGGIESWPMMANDRIGDCVIAACAHMIQEWSALASPPGFVPSDRDVIATYSAVAGYDPRNPASDRGTNYLDALNYWRKTGIAGHKILGFVSTCLRNRTELMLAIALLGNAAIGLSLPITAHDQEVWDVPKGGAVGDGAPGSWGGHGVPVVDYSPEGPICVTWGREKLMTWNFWSIYADENYAVLSPDWIESIGKAPSGFNVAQLEADLGRL